MSLVKTTSQPIVGRLRRRSAPTIPSMDSRTSNDSAVFFSEIGTQIHRDLGKDIVTVSQITVSEVDSNHGTAPPSAVKPIPPPTKKSTSITFSATVKRNGSIVQALHTRSNGLMIQEAPLEEEEEEEGQQGKEKEKEKEKETETEKVLVDEIAFSYPRYADSSGIRSPVASFASSEMRPPMRSNSIYNRPRQMSRNISFSTAQRCMNMNSQRSLSMSSSWSYQSKIYQEEAKPVYDAENELVQVSRTLLRLQKYGLLIIFFSINTIMIWATFTHYSMIWWLILAILSVNTFMQVTMAVTIILTVCGRKLWRLIRRTKDEEPAEPEKIVMLLPCYNEDRNEMQASINSLVRQVKIEKHPRIIMVVVDGNAKAPGENMSTQSFLLNEIFAGGERTVFDNGYIARDGNPMSLTIQEGTYQGVPYVVLAKARNQGKRDSLCLVRSFMWHYQNKSEDVPTMFDPELFDYIGSILMDNGIDRVDYLTGMDGDTVFADDCTYELIKAIRRAGPNTVGVCGAVLVKFDDPPAGFFRKLSFYLWTLIQNAEYMSTQGLRREFQSRVTGKVNCLPGCCQLIRVVEATFGDEVLRVKFGYVPKPNDMMTQQIMGVYSEDSLHASIIFSLFPASRTAQALRARAYTTVPTSWKVYLSQRKRWALGSLCNESLMVFRRNILWIERITSVVTITTWWIGPFIYSSVVGFLISIAHQGLHLLDDKIFAGLIAVVIFRYFYTFMIVTWFPHNWTSRGQYLIGFFMNLAVSPIINIIVTMYSLLHCDEFSWGKTRMVAPGDAGHGAHGGLVAQQSPTVKSEAGDIENQSPTFEDREYYEIDKYSHKGPVLG